jgi:hypothetical protein
MEVLVEHGHVLAIRPPLDAIGHGSAYSPYS